jgi:hypothetical protein
MLWLAASLVIVGLAGAAAIWRITVQMRAVTAGQRLMEAELRAAREEVAALKKQLLDLRIDQQQTAEAARQPMRRGGEALALLENLADPEALEGERAVAEAVAALGNTFSRDEPSSAIASLSDQGLSAAQIAHRLRIPLGEVEFLLNLRPSSTA